MTPQEQAPVRAPEFPQNVNWIQGGPKTMAELKGRVVLIDFWDYTCVNCINTLPYVKEWHKRYADAGLVIIGVHAPEFSFAHNGDHVRASVAEHGLEYPIVQDNDYAIWQAYANRYWPAHYLINHEGYLTYYHFGEGAYAETEEAIQKALETLMLGRTTVVIAHRLSTIQHANQILVMHKGIVRERGSYQHLLRQDGLYRRLYELQYRDQEERIES